MGVLEDLDRARETYERGDWGAAFDRWSGLDPVTLSADDLIAMATTAELLDRRDDAADALQRAYRLHLDAGDTRAAARCACELAMLYSTSGEPAMGAGWAARAERLLDELGEDTAERGYVDLRQMYGHLAVGELADAVACAASVTAHGRRFGDPDLVAIGLAAQGRLSLYSGGVQAGLALFDEAMVGVASGEVSPVIAGHVYCIMIEGCQEVSDLQRAAAWTTALSRWCERQPGLVAFTGQCAVHRGQIMRLHGAFRAAVAEYDGAVVRYLSSASSAAAGLAFMERGDVLRVLGELDAAEESYERAAGHGHEPQPGLVLLWLARGRTESAVAAVRRLLAERPDPVGRSRLLPAAVEVLLAGDDPDTARAVALELDTVAHDFGNDALTAMAAYAQGRVELATGDPAGSLPYLRKALALWGAMGAPYEAARTRVQVACALRALGDAESATVELTAARRLLDELGARPAADEAARLLAPATLPAGLTDREVEVLRLVATGRSNTQIAADLVLSEKTVARHLSNIFRKVEVGSRTAAAAYAFEHGLA